MFEYGSTEDLVALSVGDQRRIMREGSSRQQTRLAAELYLHAEKKKTADTAMRALALWPYWYTSERKTLISTIVRSKEAHAGNHAAYVLTRLHELWARTMYCMFVKPYEERMWIITRFVGKVDFESAELALRWSETHALPLHSEELRILTAFLKNKPA